MQYLRQRYYNPSLGRFNRADSFEGVQTIPMTRNQYIYGNGNPVTFSDPSGQVAALAGSLVNTLSDITSRLASFSPTLIQASNAISKLSALSQVSSILVPLG
ncbi:MAG: RHS repeat-associated core domain-containing protein, partial [Flammeovirgaceae bacterium]